MALPPGIETAQLSFGPYYDVITGDPVGGVKVTFSAILPAIGGKTPQIVHLPTGRVLLSRPTTITTDDSGAQGIVILPCCDATGLNITNFSYSMKVELPRPASGDSYQPVPDRIFQVRKADVGPDPIDLDELADVIAVNGQVVAVPGVSSVAGLSGVVTLSQLQGLGLGGGGAATIADGSIAIAKLAFDVATQAELNAVAATIPAAPSSASSTAQGIVELATVTEVRTGTDTARAVTPAGVAAVLADEVTRTASTYISKTDAIVAGTAAGQVPVLQAGGVLADTVIPAGIARDGEVANAVAALVNSAPGTLDTLGELATALTADEGTAATLATLVGTKAPLASPALTGIPTVNGAQVRPAHGTAMDCIGDSLTNKLLFNNGSSVTAYQDDSFLAWAAVILRQRFRLATVAGVDGNTLAQIIARLPALLAANTAGLLHLEGGINDVNSDRTFAQITADFTTAFNLAWAAGRHIIVPTISAQASANVGGTYSTARKLIWSQVNQWLLQQGATRKNLTVYDMNSALLDPATAGLVATGMLRDGTHPIALGAIRWGARLARVLDKLIPDYDILTNIGDPTNLLTTQNTSWSLFDTSGNTAAGVASTTVSRTDDVQGSWRQLVVTGTTGATLQAQVTGTYAVGDVLVARMEYERNNDWTSMATGSNAFRLELRAVPSFNSSYGLNHISGDAYPAAAVPLSGVVESPAFAVPTGTGAGGMYVVPTFQGQGTLRVGRCEVRKVG